MHTTVISPGRAVAAVSAADGCRGGTTPASRPASTGGWTNRPNGFPVYPRLSLPVYGWSTTRRRPLHARRGTVTVPRPWPGSCRFRTPLRTSPHFRPLNENLCPFRVGCGSKTKYSSFRIFSEPSANLLPNGHLVKPKLTSFSAARCRRTPMTAPRHEQAPRRAERHHHREVGPRTLPTRRGPAHARRPCRRGTLPRRPRDRRSRLAPLQTPGPPLPRSRPPADLAQPRRRPHQAIDKFDRRAASTSPATRPHHPRELRRHFAPHLDIRCRVASGASAGHLGRQQRLLRRSPLPPVADIAPTSAYRAESWRPGGCPRLQRGLSLHPDRAGERSPELGDMPAARTPSTCRAAGRPGRRWPPWTSVR